MPSENGPLDSLRKGSRTKCCLLPVFPELLSPSLGMHNTELLGGTPHLPPPVLPVVGRWGAQPWKPPLHYSRSFQFGFELQLASQGPGGRGERGVGRLDRKALVLSAPCLRAYPAKALLKASNGNVGLPPPESCHSTSTLTSWPKLISCTYLAGR